MDPQQVEHEYVSADGSGDGVGPPRQLAQVRMQVELEMVQKMELTPRQLAQAGQEVVPEMELTLPSPKLRHI